MAITKVIEIIANTEQALKDIKKLYNEQLELQKEAAKEQGKLNDEVEALGDSAKKSNKYIKAIKKGISGVGLAFKALGIGLIISAFNTLKDVFMSNQTIADGFATVMETVNIVFNKTVGVLIDAVKSSSELTGGFDALGKVLSGIVTIGLTPLKVSFYQIQKAVLTAQLAWEKSFFGDGDPKTIIELNNKILETNNNLQDVGKDALQAGKDIVNNFGEAVGEIGTLAGKTIDGVKDISISASFEQAKSITQNKKNFELLALQQARLQLQYQRDAELQRQIRDDDQLSIDERIKANDKLAETLKKQGVAEAGTITARINALQQEQKALGVTQERTNEIYQLNTDLIDLNERLSGQESEQLTNKNALLKEEIDLNNTISDAEKERRIAQLEFDASQKETELGKLEKQREALDAENALTLEDIERKRELYALGTQARVDAEQEYATKKQEIDNRITENEKAANLQKKKSAKALEDAKIGLAEAGFSILGGLAKKGSALAKGVAISQAIMSTYQGINKALAETTDVTPTQTLRFANAAAVGIAGALNVSKILSTNEAGTTSQSSPSSPTPPPAPSFNLVQGTGTNQIAEGLQSSDAPIQAYVVSSNVSTAQSLDRNIIEEASI